jgi:hypothetical protein
VQRPTNFVSANSNLIINNIGLSATNTPQFGGLTISNGQFIYSRNSNSSGFVLFTNKITSTNPQSLFAAFRNEHNSSTTNVENVGGSQIALVAQTYLWSNLNSTLADTIGFYGVASVHTNSIAGALKPIQAETRIFDNGIAGRAFGFVANIPSVSASGMITNYYAFYAARATNTNIINKYGFYQENSVMTNVFEGSLVVSNTAKMANIEFINTTNSATTRTNLGLGNGITTNITFVDAATNTNTVSISNGIITGWTQ